MVKLAASSAGSVLSAAMVAVLTTVCIANDLLVVTSAVKRTVYASWASMSRGPHSTICFVTVAPLVTTQSLYAVKDRVTR